jgi:hypothetical protein
MADVDTSVHGFDWFSRRLYHQISRVASLIASPLHDTAIRLEGTKYPLAYYLGYRRLGINAAERVEKSLRISSPGRAYRQLDGVRQPRKRAAGLGGNSAAQCGCALRPLGERKGARLIESYHSTFEFQRYFLISSIEYLILRFRDIGY